MPSVLWCSIAFISHVHKLSHVHKYAQFFYIITFDETNFIWQRDIETKLTTFHYNLFINFWQYMFELLGYLSNRHFPVVSHNLFYKLFSQFSFILKFCCISTWKNKIVFLTNQDGFAQNDATVYQETYICWLTL